MNSTSSGKTKQIGKDDDDDKSLLYADANLKSLEKTVNSELLKVSDWLNANKLTLNAKKSNYVIFRPYQRKLNYSVNIEMIDNCTQIPIPRLGVKTMLNIFASYLTWDQAQFERFSDILSNGYNFQSETKIEPDLRLRPIGQ